MWATIEISKDARGYKASQWEFISQDVGRVHIAHQHQIVAYITPAAARELALILTTLADEVEEAAG